MVPESPEEVRRPCTTAGIWHFMYSADLQIAEVWFLRELSSDEFYRKASHLKPGFCSLKTTPPQSSGQEEALWHSRLVHSLVGELGQGRGQLPEVDSL